MNIKDLDVEAFNILFSNTVEAMVKLNQDAMSQVMDKTDGEFAMFCLLESMNRLSAAIISQTIDPEQSILDFAQEIREKIAMVNQPTGTIQ